MDLTEDQLQQLRDEIKAEVLAELSQQQKLEEEKRLQQRLKDKKHRDEYVTKMKKSSEPWADIMSYIETENGFEIDVEWNDAFIDKLKQEGFTGSDEDQVISNWLNVLFTNLQNDMATNSDPGTEFV